MIKIVLASKSIDRRKILHRLGIQFEVLKTNVDEETYKGKISNPIELSMKLAELKATKANNLLKNKNDDYLIIAADTIVECKGKIIGKAKSKDQAFEILKTLNNNTHYLITGIAISQTRTTKIIRDHEITKVTFMTLSDYEIQTYIDFDEWQGRAGAYSIMDKASILIKKINGSFSNIVGLPMNKVFQILKNDFDINILSLLK
jgi:septum formation protein